MVSMPIELLDKFPPEALGKLFHVLPLHRGNEVLWLDPAGFRLARSSEVTEWDSRLLDRFDFVLHPDQEVVTSSIYL